MASTAEEVRTNVIRADIASIRRGLDNLSLALENPIYLDPVQGRLRVSVDNSIAVGTVTTITTVATVTSLTNLAGYSAKETLMDESMYNCWANSIGSLVS